MKFLKGRGSLIRSGVPLAVAALLVGCRGAEESSLELRAGGRPIVEEEVQRAVQRLLEPSEAVPFPEMRLPEAPEGFVRLAGLLESSEVETEYRMPEIQDRELLPPGGVAARGHDLIATRGKFQVKRGRNRSWLYVQTDGAWAEQIGEIIVRGSFGSAERFALGWHGGSLGIEVQEIGGIAEYAISTVGLLNFEGEMPFLRIGLPRSAASTVPEIVLESVRLRDRRAVHSAPAGLVRRRLKRELREAIYAHGTTTIRFPPVAVAAPQNLSFGVAALDRPVRLRLSIESAGERALVFDQLLENTAAWQDHTLPVAAAGAQMAVVAEFDGPPRAVGFLAAPTLYRPAPNPTRILLYLIDTQRADNLSLYGYSRKTSPYLERLAERGGWFANGFANSPWTGESVPLLLTSMHSRSNGIHREFSRLAEGFVTLPEVMGAAGYTTAAFSTNANAGPRRGTDQGFDSFFDHIASFSDDRELRTVPIPEIINWLEDRRDRSTFLYVHTAEPHDPYQPPPPYDTLFDPDYIGSEDGRGPPRRVDIESGAYTERDREHLVALYDGETAFADRMFGALCDHLEARGLLEDTLIVVTSDHGEAFGEHGKYGHGVYLYPELLRVPIVFGGGGLPSVGSLTLNAQLLDLMPTLLDLAGIEVSLPTQGESLASVMRGEGGGPPADRPILAAVYRRGGLRLSLIRGHWKLDLDLAGQGVPSVALFDMQADPGELEDLVGEYPEAARLLLRDLVGTFRELPVYGAGQSQRYEISQEQIERLRALGYIQ